MDRVYRFTVTIDPSWDIPYQATWPVFDDDTGNLVGAFLIREDSMISVFLAGTGYPLSLEISTGGAFFFTPEFDPKGLVRSATISIMKINEHSKLINEAAE